MNRSSAMLIISATATNKTVKPKKSAEKFKFGDVLYTLLKTILKRISYIICYVISVGFRSIKRITGEFVMWLFEIDDLRLVEAKYLSVAEEAVQFLINCGGKNAYG